MRIGYPCINLTLGCTSSSTFRLGTYSESRLVESVAKNLECLREVLRFNVERGLLHFRVSSGLIPLASHPICTYDWRRHFREDLGKLGSYARSNGMRLSVHPGQYTLLNTPKDDVLRNSIRDLEYHETLLSAMGMKRDAKIQIHVGGVYGDKTAALSRFTDVFDSLGSKLRSRLVVENDEKIYTVHDCISISESTRVPIVVDSLHHRANNGGIGIAKAIALAASTWRASDGPQMLDYSSQAQGRRLGSHAATLDSSDFRKFVGMLTGLDCDIMLEIKDKELSAIRAAGLLSSMRCINREHVRRGQVQGRS